MSMEVISALSTRSGSGSTSPRIAVIAEARAPSARMPPVTSTLPRRHQGRLSTLFRRFFDTFFVLLFERSCA